MGIKSAIVPLVQWAALVTGQSARRARAQQATRIITFHGVGVPDCTAEVFAAHLAYLCRNFTVVPLAQIVQRLLRREPLRGNEVALTFDDGLRNNLTIAYPLLKKFNAPATFFIVPGLIDAGRWLWVHEARERVHTLAPERARALATPLGMPDTARDVIAWMKILPQLQRLQVEQVIRAATPNFAPTPEQRAMFDLMNWDEVCSLDPALITLGAHSVNHPILANSTAAELAEEINGCRPLLEQRLGRAVEFFCYPNGDFNPAVLACARATYQAAVVVKPGFVQNGADLHQLPRINNADKLPLFAWRLHRFTA